MAIGGMEWAYRIIEEHQLDPLGGWIVMHLGWRDAPDQRTDRGIARVLKRDRKAIAKATAKLAALGIIERRSDQWVACEAAEIFDQKPTARRPSADALDDAGGGVLSTPAPSRPRPPQHPAGGVLSTPQKGCSRPPIEKENMRKGAREVKPEELDPFLRARILSDLSVVIDERLIQPGSPEMKALRRRLREDQCRSALAGSSSLSAS